MTFSGVKVSKLNITAMLLVISMIFGTLSISAYGYMDNDEKEQISEVLPKQEVFESGMDKLTEISGEIAVASSKRREPLSEKKSMGLRGSAGSESEWTITAYYINETDMYHVCETDNFSLKYQIEMQIDRYIRPFGIKIVIPAALMIKRDGDGTPASNGCYPVYANDIAVPMGTPEHPVISKTLCFNYYIDEDGNYVFFNYDTVQTGTNAAFQVLYKNLDMMELVDGSTWSLPGYAEVDDERKDMPVLTGVIDSHADLTNVSKSNKTIQGKNYGPELYTAKQINRYATYKILNETPDFERYAYLAWDISVSAEANQPYNISFSDVVSNGGQIVGFSKNVTSLGNGNYELVHDCKKKNYNDKLTVVVRYPFNNIKNNDGTYKQITNDVNVTLDPVDQVDPDQTASGHSERIYREYQWKYEQGGHYLSKTDAGDYYSWLDVYKLSVGNENSVAAVFPFTVKSAVNDYGYTHIVNSDNGGRLGELIDGRSYVMITEDKLMYSYYNAAINDRIELSESDYYFSSVKVSFSDTGYDPYEDETDVPHDNCNMKIYAQFYGKNDYELVSEVPGTSGVYEFPADLIARQPYHIRAERETVNYRTECEIELNVCIKKDSPVFGNYVSHLQNSGGNVENVTLVNVADMFYAEKSGNNITQYDPVLKTGEARLYQLTPHAEAMKTGTLVRNDSEAGCVRIRYNLMEADGYYVYDQRDIDTLSQNSGFLSPGRNKVVFYDLLPYGIQFDPSQEVHAGRLMDLDMENTFYSNFNSNQVTVRVDPQDIVFNYNNTGRTLVAFRLELPSDFKWQELISDPHNRRSMWCEAWGVSFGAYYSWVDEKIAGSTTNIACFLPNDVTQDNFEQMKNIPLLGEANKVFPDNGAAPSDYSGFGSDINHDNVTNIPTVIYMKGAVNSMVAQASESEIVKEVRADYDKFGEFSRAATVPLGQGYIYRIRIKTVQTPLTGIVIYDYFETARDRDSLQELITDQFVFDENTNYWHGTFDYIIDNDLRSKIAAYNQEHNDNVEPVYYYYIRGFDEHGHQLPRDLRENVLVQSDNTGVDINNPSNLLTQENGWYRREDVEQMQNNDDIQVYGIAVDLGNFRLNPNDTISLRIHMTSPPDDMYSDRENYPYCHDSEAKAEFSYNDAKYFARQIINGEALTSATITSIPTVVSQMNPSSIEIAKNITAPVSASNAQFTFHVRMHRRGDCSTVWNGTQFVAIPNYIDFAHQEYKLYNYNENTGTYEPSPMLLATDEYGNLKLRDGQMAKFMNIDKDSEVLIDELDNPFWECTYNHAEVEGAEIYTVRHDFENKYRPVLYFTKHTVSVPEDIPPEAANMTFKFRLTANGQPVGNKEYWIVADKRTDGQGISPTLIEKRYTDSNGNFTLKSGQTAALLPGEAGVNYHIEEFFDYETREYWVPYDEKYVKGVLDINGSECEMKNVYLLKKLMLTKRVSHMEIHDSELEFKFTMSYAEGTQPIMGLKWKKSDEENWRITSEEDPYITMKANETVIIKDLIAERTYDIKEYLDGEEYENYRSISGDLDGVLTVGMPKFEQSTSAEYFNDYILRNIVIKKRVAYDPNDTNVTELDSKEFKMYFEIQKDYGSEEYVSGKHEFTREKGSETSTEYTDDDGNFFIKRGETVTFHDAVKEGLKYRIYEYKDDEFIQIYPVSEGEYETGQPQTPFTGTAGKTACVAEFTNGKKGIFIVGKEYISVDGDTVGQEYIERMIKQGDRKKEAIDLKLELFCKTDEFPQGIWRTFPTVENKKVDVVDLLTGDIESEVHWEQGSPIHIEPWKQVVINSSHVQAQGWTGAYRITESESDKYKIYDSDFIKKDTYVVIDPEYEEAMYGDRETKPVTVIKNIVRSVEPESVVCKRMLGGSDAVAEGSELKMEVQVYNGVKWLPAGDIPYFVCCYDSRRCDLDYNVTSIHEQHVEMSSIQRTSADGKITLRKHSDGTGSARKYMMPKIIFPEHDVKAYVDHAVTGSYRIIELLDEDTENEWGQFVGTETLQNVSTIVNSKREAQIEVEKFVTGNMNDENDFTFELRQLTDIPVDPGTITDSQINSSVTGKNIPYRVYEPDGSNGYVLTGTQLYTANDGTFTLKHSQFARFYVQAGTAWTVSEKTASSALANGIYDLSGLEVSGTGGVPRNNLAVLKTSVEPMPDYIFIAADKVYVCECEDSGKDGEESEPFYKTDINVVAVDSSGKQTVVDDFQITSFVYTDSNGIDRTLRPKNDGTYRIPSKSDSTSARITVSYNGMQDTITLPVAKLATVTSKTDSGHATGVQYNIPGIGKTLFINYMTDDYYTLDGEHLAWTGSKIEDNSRPEMDLIIPDVVVDKNGRYFAIKAIGDNAFRFKGFQGKLKLPERLIKIGIQSFRQNFFTGALYLPNHVREIGNNSFYKAGFTGELHITENQGYKIIESSTFTDCDFRGVLVVPDNITVIKDKAFQNIGFDSNLELSQNLTKIESTAFYGNSFTGNLYIPDTVNYIGTIAFARSGFTGDLHLPANPEYTEIFGMVDKTQGVFQDCGFRRIEIPPNVSIIGKRAFQGNTSLVGTVGVAGSRLVIPDTMTLINDWAFAGCTSLYYVEIPNTLTLGTFEDTFENVTVNMLDIRVTDSSEPLSQVFRGNFRGVIIGITGVEGFENSLEITGPIVNNQGALRNIFIGKGVKSISPGVFNGISTTENVCFHIDRSHVNDQNILGAIPDLPNVTIDYLELA